MASKLFTGTTTRGNPGLVTGRAPIPRKMPRSTLQIQGLVLAKALG